jgi:hypothetical protein
MLHPDSATIAKFWILFSNNSHDPALPARILIENLQRVTKNAFMR